MPVMRALVNAVDGLVLRTALPTWLISLTKRGRQALCGYNEMEVGHPITLHGWIDSHSDDRNT